MRPTRRKLRPLVVPSLLPLLSLLLVVAPAAAQGTARVMDIDGSAISSAMGGASAAVFWSAEPNAWANPALLGYYRGVRYQYARSQLVPGLADDVFLTADRVTLGAYGVGLEVGRTKLDYGGEDGSYEEVGAVAAGVSLAGLVRGVAPQSLLATLGRDFDLAVGIARKDVEMRIGFYGEEPVKPSAAPCDIGVLARTGHDFGGAMLPLRLDAGLGASILNFNDVEFTFPGVFSPSPPSRLRRLGGTVRLAIGQPAAWSRDAGSGFAAAFVRGLGPLVSIGGAWDAEHVQAGDDEGSGYDVTHLGLEVSCLDLLSLRVGHVMDRTGEIEDVTWGLGIGLPIAGVGGARYDYAQYPQSGSLPNVTRHTASVFVDPIALWQRTRGK